MKTNPSRSIWWHPFGSLTFILLSAQILFAAPSIKYAAFGEFEGEPAIDINGESLHIKDDDPIVRLGGKELTILGKDADGNQLIMGGIPTDILDGTHLLRIETEDGADEMDITLVPENPQAITGLIGEKGAAGADGVSGANGVDGVNGVSIASNISGDSSTGLFTFPVNNTAGGLNALDSDTTGFNNSAYGFDSLTDNTTGFDNTATGKSALQHNSTGRDNTASGVNALRDNTTGQFNSATGKSALTRNTTGNSNTASGVNALFSNTTGDFNTATGNNALIGNTTGKDNTATGKSALLRNTTGESNTAAGRSALFSNTIGNNNIAVGNGAGANLVSGSDNIYLGSQAGSDTESNTIRIGRNQMQTFLKGVRDVVPSQPDALPVVIDSNGQLGTIATFPASGIYMTGVQHAPKYRETRHENFNSGHGYTKVDGGSGTVTDDTSIHINGDRSLKLTTQGDNNTLWARSLPFSAINLTNRNIVTQIRCDNPENISQLRFSVSSDNFVSDSLTWYLDQHSSIREGNMGGEWITISLSFGDVSFSIGSPKIDAVNSVQLNVKDDGAGVVECYWGNWGSFPKEPRGKVVLMFDDGHDDAYDEAKKKMSQYGMVGVADINPSIIGSSDRLTVAELFELQNVHGWEIALQPIGNLTAMSIAEAEQVVKRGRQWMIENGFRRGISHYAYAGGFYNSPVVSLIRNYFVSARTAGPGTNVSTYPPDDWHLLQTWPVINTDTPTTMGAAVDQAITHKELLIFTFHIITAIPGSGSEISTDNFGIFIDDLAAHVAAGDIDVVTLSQAMEDL